MAVAGRLLVSFFGISAERCVENAQFQGEGPGMTKVMTVSEVSAYLRVHPGTIYRLVRRGALPAFRIGSDWRFNIEAIDQWRLEGGNRDPGLAARKNDSQ
jgi:excisionase family DNA binding protein